METCWALHVVESTGQCPFHPLVWSLYPSCSHGSRNCLIQCFRSKPELKLQHKEIGGGQQKDKHIFHLTWKAKAEPFSCGKFPVSPCTGTASMWVPVSWFRYNTSLFYPCGEQHEDLVCFFRRTVMTKGVTAPFYHCLMKSCSHVIRWNHRYKVVQLNPSRSSQSVQGFICPCGVQSLHH